jgi:hypothetical protein
VKSSASVLAIAIIFPLVLSACASDPKEGYVWGSGASYDRSIRTVAVPIFQNTTYSRGIETELTDAIIKQIQAETPWRVASGGDAQTELSGSITDSRLRQLSINRDTGFTQELDVELTVDFTWRDKRSGKVLVSRKSFTASEAFIPSKPVGERLEAGQHAAIQRLARDIVSELRSNW